MRGAVAGAEQETKEQRKEEAEHGESVGKDEDIIIFYLRPEPPPSANSLPTKLLQNIAIKAFRIHEVQYHIYRTPLIVLKQGALPVIVGHDGEL